MENMEKMENIEKIQVEEIQKNTPDVQEEKKELDSIVEEIKQTQQEPLKVEKRGRPRKNKEESTQVKQNVDTQTQNVSEEEALIMGKTVCAVLYDAIPKIILKKSISYDNTRVELAKEAVKELGLKVSAVVVFVSIYVMDFINALNNK